MSHPPYHLRPNKAIDRFILIEAIRKLEKIGSLPEYTYYGLGGPYLEEFRVLSELCPEIGMVSIEKDINTLKRQKFHRPCKTLRLVPAELRSFLINYDPKDEKSIFWLDYTKLLVGAFEDFQVIVGKVAANSIIKITLQSMPRDYYDVDSEGNGKADKFKKEFGVFMPDPLAAPPLRQNQFVKLLQDMLQIAAQKILPADVDMAFQPLTSFYYADGATMFTLTGIVCKRNEQRSIRKIFKDLRFANLDWGQPKLIDIPILSTKERLHLQKHLPIKHNTGRRLQKALGYKVDEHNSIDMMKQYSEFYRYYPYFVRVIP